MPHLIESKSFCPLPFTKLIIDEFGHATMCCHQSKPLGNIFKQDLLSIWQNHVSQRVRTDTKLGLLNSACSESGTCPYIAHPKPDRDFLTHPGFTHPTHIEICLPSSHCNIGGENPSKQNPACIMCIRNHDLLKHEVLTDQICAKVKPFMPYLNEFTVLGVAEPFWKDELYRVFDMVDYHMFKDQIKFTTNTNGICLTDSTLDEFFRRVSKSEMSVSIDAATPETFMKIRRLDTYDLICKNIKSFMRKREQFGKENHVIKIYNNINLINVHEMGMMVEAAAELGVDELLLIPTHDQMGRVDLGEILMNESNIKIFQRFAMIAQVRAIEMNVKLVFGNTFHIAPTKTQVIEKIGVKRD